MASVRALVRMKRAGVYHPPGTVFHDFDLDEAESLGSKRVAILDHGDAPASAPEIADPIPTGSASDEGVTVDDVPPGADPAQAPGGANGRVAEIMHAFDLLDEGDWAATGRPKLRPLADVLGYKPTAEEITAALDLRDAL